MFQLEFQGARLFGLRSRWLTHVSKNPSVKNNLVAIVQTLLVWLSTHGEMWGEESTAVVCANINNFQKLLVISSFFIVSTLSSRMS